jgi:hypothetical protein
VFTSPGTAIAYGARIVRSARPGEAPPEWRILVATSAASLSIARL